MSINAEQLGKIVVARFGDGALKLVGVMIGYCDEPTAIIRTADGEQVSWVASLCESVPMSEDVNEQIKVLYKEQP